MKPLRPLLAEPQSRVAGILAAGFVGSPDVPDFEELFMRGFAPPNGVNRENDPFLHFRGKSSPGSLTLYDYRQREGLALKECYKLHEDGRRCRDRRIVWEDGAWVLHRQRKGNVEVDSERRKLLDRRVSGRDRRASSVARRRARARHVDNLVSVAKEMGRTHPASRLVLDLLSKVITSALRQKSFEDWLTVWETAFWERDWSWEDNYKKYVAHAMLGFVNFVRQRGEMSYQAGDDLEEARRLGYAFNQNKAAFCWRLLTEETLAGVRGSRGSQHEADLIREGKAFRFEGSELLDFLIERGVASLPLKTWKRKWKRSSTKEAFKKALQRMEEDYPPVKSRTVFP